MKSFLAKPLQKWLGSYSRLGLHALIAALLFLSQFSITSLVSASGLISLLSNDSEQLSSSGSTLCPEIPTFRAQAENTDAVAELIALAEQIECQDGADYLARKIRRLCATGENAVRPTSSRQGEGACRVTRTVQAVGVAPKAPSNDDLIRQLISLSPASRAVERGLNDRNGVQLLLLRHGCYAGRIDGQIGGGSIRAINQAFEGGTGEPGNARDLPAVRTWLRAQGRGLCGVSKAPPRPIVTPPPAQPSVGTSPARNTSSNQNSGSSRNTSSSSTSSQSTAPSSSKSQSSSSSGSSSLSRIRGLR